VECWGCCWYHGVVLQMGCAHWNLLTRSARFVWINFLKIKGRFFMVYSAKKYTNIFDFKKHAIFLLLWHSNLFYWLFSKIYLVNEEGIMLFKFQSKKTATELIQWLKS
jgi:hypothetical protein